jgi:hypothetical protein
MKLPGSIKPLRELKLETVAEYLKCDPARLRKALKAMVEAPSAIEYAPGQVAAIDKAISYTPAELAEYLRDPVAEIVTLDALYNLQDGRPRATPRK